MPAGPETRTTRLLATSRPTASITPTPGSPPAATISASSRWKPPWKMLDPAAARPARRGRAARSSSRAPPATTGGADRRRGCPAAPGSGRRARPHAVDPQRPAARRGQLDRERHARRGARRSRRQRVVVLGVRASAPAADARLAEQRSPRRRRVAAERAPTRHDPLARAAASGSRLVASTATSGSQREQPLGDHGGGVVEHVLAVVEHDQRPARPISASRHHLRSSDWPGRSDTPIAAAIAVDDACRGRPAPGRRTTPGGCGADPARRPRWPAASCRCRRDRSASPVATRPARPAPPARRRRGR